MKFVGHDGAWREWRAAMASERMHHAWLVTGPRGLGKSAFARAAASELVAEPGVHQPPLEQHPDILVPEYPPESKEEARKRDEGKEYRVKRNIPISEIRALQHRLVTRPTLGSRRAIIVDCADDLEPSAVNALLKSLEEPPAGTYFLLVSHQPGRLLPTIRSRCRILRLAPLDDEAVDALLRREAPSATAETRAAAVAAAQGSPAAALAFVNEDLAPLHAMMQRLVREGDPAFVLRGALADELGAKPDRKRLAAVFDLARSTLVEGLADAPRRRQAQIIEAHGAITRLAGQAPTFNFDPGLLIMEIGGLLASAAMPTEAAS